MTRKPPRSDTKARRVTFERADLDKIVVLLRAGVTKEIACDRARVVRGTFYRWLKRGRANLKAVGKGEEELDEYGLLAMEVAEAQAECLELAHTCLGKAASKDPAWALRYIERHERSMRNVRARGDTPHAQQVQQATEPEAAPYDEDEVRGAVEEQLFGRRLDERKNDERTQD